MSSKVWFITGCSSGFGEQLALEALRRGDKVIATARNENKIQQLKSAGADILALDVTAPLEELKKSAEKAYRLYGRIDYLVNNAGYAQIGGLEELSSEETQAQFATNVFGLLNTTRALLPYFRAQRSGVIANISSVGAWRGPAGVGLYCASKWAVSALSETMHGELADFNIKVCCIEPGYFRSRFLNSGNKVTAKQLISDYDGTTVRKGTETLDAYDNKQPGDIKKGAKVMVDVLTQVTGKDIPLRLALGPDSYNMIHGKCEETIKLLDEWREVSCSTDIEE